MLSSIHQHLRLLYTSRGPQQLATNTSSCPQQLATNTSSCPQQLANTSSCSQQLTVTERDTSRPELHDNTPKHQDSAVSCSSQHEMMDPVQDMYNVLEGSALVPFTEVSLRPHALYSMLQSPSTRALQHAAVSVDARSTACCNLRPYAHNSMLSTSKNYQM